MTSPNPLPSQPDLSPLSVVRMLWKQKLHIVVTWAALSVLALMIVYLLPAVYRAETMILVDSQKIPERYVAATVSAELQDRLATIRQQIYSSTNLQRIIETFDLYRNERNRKSPQEEIIELMRKDIQISLERGWSREKPAAFRIAYQGANPAVVAEVANQIGQFFIVENLRSRENQSEGTSEFLKHQLEAAKKSLDEQEAKVSRYKVANSGELPQQENALQATLSRLQLELQGNQDATNRAQQNKTMLEHALTVAEASQAVLLRAIDQAAANPTAAAVLDTPGLPPRKRSDQLQTELDSMLARYSENHPEVRRLNTELTRARQTEQREGTAAEAKRTPERAGKKEPGGPTMSLMLTQEVSKERERVASLKSQLALAIQELENRNDERKRILRDIDAYRIRIERLPVREQEVSGLTRDYEMSKTNYQGLLDKKMAAEMATEMERRQKAELFRTLDPARAPEKPFKPDRLLLGSVACGASLLIGMALAVGREMKRNAFLGEWELPAEVLVLGRVPRIELAGARPARQKGGRLSRRRLAVVSSALLSLLAALGAGFYLWGGS